MRDREKDRKREKTRKGERERKKEREGYRETDREREIVGWERNSLKYLYAYIKKENFKMFSGW